MTDRPVWVKLTLWGVPSRRAAWAYLSACLVIGAAGPVAALVIGEPRIHVVAAMVLAAIPYGAAIGWMDRHRAW